MLNRIEEFAASAAMRLSSKGHLWTCDNDHPHINFFHYEVGVIPPEEDELTVVGAVDGYRITQDWTVGSDLALWDEADALDGDAVRYIEALIRELRVCEQVFGDAPSLTIAQRITIVRHFEPKPHVDPTTTFRGAVASLAMMDSPVFMLVDPWPMAEERSTAKGKLKGRGQVPKLLQLGLVRMVASRFLWGWNAELQDLGMSDYSYEKLLAARRLGALEAVLRAPLFAESYGALPKEIAEMIDLPDPEELMDE